MAFCGAPLFFFVFEKKKGGLFLARLTIRFSAFLTISGYRTEAILAYQSFLSIGSIHTVVFLFFYTQCHVVYLRGQQPTAATVIQKTNTPFGCAYI